MKKNYCTDNSDEDDNGNEDFKSLYCLALVTLSKKLRFFMFLHQNSSCLFERLATLLSYELHFFETEKITFWGKDGVGKES